MKAASIASRTAGLLTMTSPIARRKSDPARTRSRFLPEQMMMVVLVAIFTVTGRGVRNAVVMPR